MATYVVGDVQGCLAPLRALLSVIDFSAERDRLWFAGDLVNRGPNSLEVLRFVRALGDTAVCVLGNHDLHLLAVAAGVAPSKPRDTLAPILAAPDRDDLLQWLRAQPLFHYDAVLAWGCVHAGLLPQWDLAQTRTLAAETATALRGPDYADVLASMYGNEPTTWSDSLAGKDRLRVVINAMTRMRFCSEMGAMRLEEKGAPGSQPPGVHPWFAVPARKSDTLRLAFGHWSALGSGRHPATGALVSLDSGCVWGRALTTFRVDDERFFSVPCAVD